MASSTETSRSKLLLLIGLLLAATAVSAQTIPPSARQALTVPQLAAKLAKSCALPQKMPLHSPAGACVKQPPGEERIPVPGPHYANGPSDGLCDIQHCEVDAWTINFGYAVTNSFPARGAVAGITFAAWLFPGDVLQSVEVLITSQKFGGTQYFDGVARVTQSNCSMNSYGFNVCVEQASFESPSLDSGTYWIALENATVNTGDPVYWDENAGPSLAAATSIGTIPSESFNTAGGNVCIPEQSGNFSVIHDFSGGEDGSSPAGVTLDRAGNLYGRANLYNANHLVYKLAQAGSGWVLSKLHEFLGGDEGSTPNGLIVGPHDNLYGGIDGGLQNCNGGPCGMIFGLRPFPRVCGAMSCGWMENILYRFTGPTDAVNGSGLVSDRDGNLYGVSSDGGAQQKGAVFKLAPTIGGWTETILYSFAGDLDGGAPTYLMVGNDGNLYGGAAQGGAYSSGVVFRLTPTAGGWTQSVLYDLPSQPYFPTTPRSLVQDASGNLSTACMTTRT